MSFMIRISIQALPLVAFIPWLWGAVALVVGTSVYSRRKLATGPTTVNDVPRIRWLLELAGLLVAPLAMLALGRYVWPEANARSPYETQALYVLHGLCVSHVATAVFLTWRHRLRLIPTIGATLLSIWWAFGAWFTAGMAITNNWL